MEFDKKGSHQSLGKIFARLFADRNAKVAER